MKFNVRLEDMASNVDSAPKSTLPYPPIHKDKKFVVLSDWLVNLPVCHLPLLAMFLAVVF